MTRRTFLGTTAVTMAAASAAGANAIEDGPVTAGFSPVPLKGNIDYPQLAEAGLSETLRRWLEGAPRGKCVSWRIPFEIGRPVLLRADTVTEKLAGLKAQWLVFFHPTDVKALDTDERGFPRPMRGEGFLNEHAADYVLVYADGTEERHAGRRRHEIGMLRRRWGENCFQAVIHRKPRPVLPVHAQASSAVIERDGWGPGETRVQTGDGGAWVNWLWAWENPHPEKEIAAIRFEPKDGATVVSALSAGNASSQPLRWESRRKAILRLPEGEAFENKLDSEGRWRQIQLDMGQVISAQPRTIYPNADWADTYNNQVPELSKREVLIEYTAHRDARFHISGGSPVPVADVKPAGEGPLVEVARATRRVKIRVVEKSGGKPVPVKLHLHGGSGEYLAPVDRHRQPNPE